MKDRDDIRDLIFTLSMLVLVLIAMGLAGCVNTTLNADDCTHEFIITEEPEHQIHQQCWYTHSDS